MTGKKTSASILIPLLILVGLAAAYGFVYRPTVDPLVVYCAHDAVYSESILRQFEQETGIPLAVRFDTEATKSLGLTEFLIREKDAPRCDVFWNNEALGTMALQERGVLQPYQGTGWKRMPGAFKDSAGHWTGFAARLRVTIVNTDQQAATQEAVGAALKEETLSRVAMARPLYGTTLTHYSVLWNLWGPEKLKAWHHDLRNRGLQEVASNGQVKDAVGGGVCAMGITDTDDFFVAKDAGRPVAMQPVRLDTPERQTICIPNTVAIIKGTKRESQAQQLVDWLLSKETETRLAHATSRQIPLGPVDDAELPEEVRELRTWAKDGVSLNTMLADRNACLAWLKTLYAR